MRPDPRTPVVVGVAQHTWHPGPDPAPEPEIDQASLRKTDREFDDLASDPTLDAALIVCGAQHRGLLDLLGGGEFRLVVMPEVGRVDHPTFHAHVIRASEYPESLQLPRDGYMTLATPALWPAWRGRNCGLAGGHKKIIWPARGGGTVIRALKRICGSVRYSGFGARAQFAGISLPHLPGITATR